MIITIDLVIFMTKYSHQREIIYNILSGVKTHPTAQWIYDESRKSIPNISLGTVYRNLTKLKNDNRITSFSIGNGTEHFDADTSVHAHFCCNKCGSILDVMLQGSKVEKLEDEVNHSFGCTVENTRLLFYGICKDCNR